MAVTNVIMGDKNIVKLYRGDELLWQNKFVLLDASNSIDNTSGFGVIDSSSSYSYSVKKSGYTYYVERAQTGVSNSTHHVTLYCNDKLNSKGSFSKVTIGGYFTSTSGASHVFSWGLTNLSDATKLQYTIGEGGGQTGEYTENFLTTTEINWDTYGNYYVGIKFAPGKYWGGRIAINKIIFE